MNSVIISSIARFFTVLWTMFTDSGVYRLFEKIYLAISGSWKKSRIVNGLKDDSHEGMARQSLIYRIFNAPFRWLTIFRMRTGKSVRRSISRSIIVRLGRVLYYNVIALNSRFLGVMMLSSLVSAGITWIFTRNVSVVVLAIGIIGAIFCLGNVNMTEFFNHSGFVSFCFKAVGLETVNFSFYKEEKTGGRIAAAVAVLIGFAAGLLSVKSVLFTLALPIGLFCIALIFAVPIAGIFFAVLIAPIGPTMALAGIALITAVSAVIKTIITPKMNWRMDGTGLGLCIMLGILLISSLTSFTPIKSTTVWIMYLIFVGFYFVIVNTVKTKEQLYSLIKVFTLMGALIALYGIMQYVFGWNTSNAWIDENMFEEATMRAYSTMGNPNVLGEYLLLVLPLSAVFALKYSWKRLAKWVYMLIFAGTALCLVFTQSRGCWLGFMLSAFIFVTFYNGRWWKILPVFLVILPFIIPQTMIDRLMSIGDMGDSSTSYRVFIWLGTLDMMRHFWIGGIGMGEGAFNTVYPFYSYNAIVAPHSHNTFLQLLVEGGIGAVAAFIGTMIVFLKKMASVYKQKPKTALSSMLALAIASGVAGFLLQSMFDYTFYNYRMMAMFFMFMAFGTLLHKTTVGGNQNEKNN